MTDALLTDESMKKNADQNQTAGSLRDLGGSRLNNLYGSTKDPVSPFGPEMGARKAAQTEMKIKRPLTSRGSMSQKRKTIEIKPNDTNDLSQQIAMSDVGSEYFGSDEDKQTKQLTNMNQKRYGKKINAGSYQFGNTSRFISLFLAVAFAPLQLLFNGIDSEWELNTIILPLQKKIVEWGWNKGFANDVLSFPLFLFHQYATFFFMSVIYMYADSLISFKANFLLCFGIVLTANLQMYFRDGRPFWDHQEVEAFAHCSFQFASPSMEMFVLTFYWLYNLVQHRFKYATNQSNCGNYALVIIQVAFTLWLYFAGVANGFNYVYQLFMGQALGFICLVLCLNFDSEIHKYCVKTGFILQASRAKKFEVFFIMIVIFLISTTYYLSISYVYNVPQNWLLNATSGENECMQLFYTNSHNQIGYAQTYDCTSFLFIQLGMVFGQSYSLNYVKPLRWVHSNKLQKVVRTILGGTLAFGIRVSLYFAFRASQEMLTRFIWVDVVPSFFASFFVFGIFPIICQHIGLVAKETSAEIEARLKAEKLNHSREKALKGTFNTGSIVSSTDQEQQPFRMTMQETPREQ